MDIISVTFTILRQTKNTVVFKEDQSAEGEPAIGTLYLRKDYYDAIGRPKKIRVRVQAET